MKINHLGREYELPSDKESLEQLSESTLQGRAPYKYCSPTSRGFHLSDIQDFIQQYPQAFNRNKKTIEEFAKAVMEQIVEFCVNDKEGVLLSDDLGVLIVGKYKHNRQYLVNLRTRQRYVPLINGDYLLRVFWLRPDIKEFRPLHLYRYARDPVILRKASNLFHNGKMDYNVINEQNKLTSELMQISIMKQKYDAPFK
jgi:hypothetical protein